MASILKAKNMNKAKISSVDRVNQFISTDTSKTEYKTTNNVFQRPTQPNMSQKSTPISCDMSNTTLVQRHNGAVVEMITNGCPPNKANTSPPMVCPTRARLASIRPPVFLSSNTPNAIHGRRHAKYREMVAEDVLCKVLGPTKPLFD